MRCAALAFVATLASVVGSAALSSEPKSVALGESFDLRVGESAQIEAEALQIGFEDVAADSRCPKGERCIWEGDATVRVWMKKASDPKETLELHTSPKEPGALSDLSYGLRLLGLEPHPVSGRAIEQRDYLATFEVTREPSAPPDSL